MNEQNSQPAAESAAPAAPQANWREQLPEDMRMAPALQSFNDLSSMAKSYLEAQTRLGNSIRVPSHEAGDEDRAAFRKRILEVGADYGVTAIPGEDETEREAFYRSMGVPDDAEGYEIPTLEDPDVNVDMSEAATLRAKAKELGMTKKQYGEFVKAAAQGRLEAAKGAMQRRDAEHATLHKEWGQAYEQRFNQIERFLDINGAPKLLQQAVKGRQVDAETSRWLHGMMESLGGETSEIAAQGKGGNGASLTPAEALDRMSEIEKRMDSVSPGSEEYQSLIKRRVELMRVANG